MYLDEKELIDIAKAFRKAIELTDFSIENVGEEGHLRMRHFPEGCCAEVTTSLALYLKYEYNVQDIAKYCAQIEEGSKWYGTHEWLEHNGIIIDITANQFPMVAESIIVARESDFHNKYAKKKSKLTTVFGLEHLPDYKISIYESIMSTLQKV